MHQSLKVLLSFLILIIAFNLSISCIAPQSDRLSSEDRDRNDRDDDRDRDDDDEDDDDDDRSSRRSDRTCDERDSCQDTCDDMFDNVSERNDCYDLSSSEVNAIADVHDEFWTVDWPSNTKTVATKGFTKSNLEDISAEDFESYLDIGIKTFVERVENVNGTKWNGDRAKYFLEWAAENPDISDILLEKDTTLEVAQQVFLKMNNHPWISIHPFEAQSADLEGTGGGSVQYVHSPNKIFQSCSNARATSCTGNTPIFSLSKFNLTVYPHHFVLGFINRKWSSETFIELAFDERNDSAFEWAHNSLVDFCVEGTDEDEGDVEVKTCVHTIYCITGNDREEVFDELDERENIVGYTKKSYCKYNDLTDDDRMEKLFE